MKFLVRKEYAHKINFKTPFFLLKPNITLANKMIHSPQFDVNTKLVRTTKIVFLNEKNVSYLCIMTIKITSIFLFLDC